MIKPTTLLADDHPMIIDGLKRLLADQVAIVGCCSDGEALFDLALSLNPELVITDLSMPGLGGLAVIRRLRREGVRPRVIILSMYTDSGLIESAFLAGAMAYVPKHAAGEELLLAIREVLSGRTYVSPLINTPARAFGAPPAPLLQLSKRQREVLHLVAKGKRMKEIAAELELSRRTVEMHKYEMMHRLGLKTTAELIQYYYKHEMVAKDAYDQSASSSTKSGRAKHA